MNDNDQLERLTYQKIKRVVFSGGGAKGVSLSSVPLALSQLGVLEGVEAFAGSSVGAISASLLAAGMSPNVFRDVALNTNLETLLGNLVLTQKEGVIRGITKDGKPLETFIRSNICKAIKDALEQIPNLQTLGEKEPELRTLYAKAFTQNPVITFADLALLNRLFPLKFKKLVILAVRYPHGEVQAFDAESTPDVEIALACRASAAIPAIFEPVLLKTKTGKHLYVDGGLYDNLPTDYFDKVNDRYVANKKPKQTLVFAFGEGVKNKISSVFNALYGDSWSEFISDTVLSEAFMAEITPFINFPKTLSKTTRQNNYHHLREAIYHHLGQYVAEKKLTPSAAEIIELKLLKAFAPLFASHGKNTFWKRFTESDTLQQKAIFLRAYLIGQLELVIYKAGLVDKMIRDVLTKVFAGLKTPYKNTQQKEIGFQRLKHEYPLRTVELRVGKVHTRDFKKATSLAREMDSFGYLDTVNFLTNHDLEDRELFVSEQYYQNLINQFQMIYRATLLGSKMNPEHDTVLKKIAALKMQLQLQSKRKPNAIISRQIYQLIREEVESKLDSVAAFALCRAVEFSNHSLSADQLLKEVYEESFKRSSFFSKSGVTGSCFFRSTPLHEALKSQQMFLLFTNKQKRSPKKKRIDMIFECLNKISGFKEAYDDFQRTAQNIVTTKKAFGC